MAQNCKRAISPFIYVKWKGIPVGVQPWSECIYETFLLTYGQSLVVGARLGPRLFVVEASLLSGTWPKKRSQLHDSNGLFDSPSSE